VEATHLICDGLCSDEGFFYFRLWLIGLGRDAFELAMAHPDNLASLPEVVALMGRPMKPGTVINGQTGRIWTRSLRWPTSRPPATGTASTRR
jgi:hypothetical protein